jgi:hypothetical protein
MSMWRVTPLIRTRTLDGCRMLGACFLLMKLCQPSINQSNPQKRGKQGTKWKDPCPRRQMNHLRGWTTKGTSSFWTRSYCDVLDGHKLYFPNCYIGCYIMVGPLGTWCSAKVKLFGPFKTLYPDKSYVGNSCVSNLELGMFKMTLAKNNAVNTLITKGPMFEKLSSQNNNWMKKYRFSNSCHQRIIHP